MSRAAAGACITLLLACGARRIALDGSAPAWDEAWYLENSFRLYHALVRGLADFAAAWTGAFRIKAPLASLTPLPLYALAGPSETAGRFAALGAHAAMLAAAWAAARALWREHPRCEGIAALSAVLTALIPLLFGLSRLLLVESLLAALVAATAWRLAQPRPRPGDGARLGLLLGLGLLCKVSFPVFVAGPLWLRRRGWAASARPALLVAGAVAATWYAFNLPYVLGFAWSAAFGRLAADYAVAGAGPLDFPARLAAQALSWPLAATMAAVLAAGAFDGRRRPLDEGVKLCLLWLAPLLVFAASPNAEVRLAAPALPALALLCARAAFSLEGAGRAAAVTVLLAAGGHVFVRETFVSRFGQTLPWSGVTAASEPFDRAALVDAASAAAGTDGVAALALEHPALNANNLSSLAAARGLGLRVISLGYAQDSAEGALLRLKDRDASALILLDGVATASGTGFLNRANAGVEAAVASGRLPARLTAVVRAAPGVRARVYRIGRGID